MPITECGKGHVYDTDQYAACPYCNGGRSIIDFDGGANRTMAPGMGGATAAPYASMGRTEAVNYAANANEPGRTVAPEAYRKRQEEESKTVGVFKKEHEYDPVVGWLVCIDGPEKGKDYHLWARINTIGRSESMDVCIKKDNTISKENHARLAYDPKHNNFQLIPADSTNNIYINEEPIYVPTRLAPYDVIEIGASKMAFVPFCCDRFQWTTGVVKEKEG